ncbi:MAG: hypothetical protein R2824_01575 [Saprospiraceae bacterium]|nr:hypothetical protein [Lewinella sp.]
MPYLNQRIGALIFLLFCGYLEVLGVVPDPIRQLGAPPAMELLEKTGDSDDTYADEVSSYHNLPLRLTDTPLLYNSFSATLRTFAMEVDILIRRQQQQFIHHKNRCLLQVASPLSGRIDLPERSAFLG